MQTFGSDSWHHCLLLSRLNKSWYLCCAMSWLADSCQIWLHVTATASLCIFDIWDWHLFIWPIAMEWFGRLTADIIVCDLQNLYIFLVCQCGGLWSCHSLVITEGHSLEIGWPTLSQIRLSACRMLAKTLNCEGAYKQVADLGTHGLAVMAESGSRLLSKHVALTGNNLSAKPSISDTYGSATPSVIVTVCRDDLSQVQPIQLELSFSQKIMTVHTQSPQWKEMGAALMYTSTSHCLVKNCCHTDN